ncbi:protein kinase [Streptomyces sp. NPDC093085]|uniref:protein kinase domain-containing protein n=1 Tax=Streptomyces sp. NPDC093085 TaxID=3155068 RepID=UPI00341A9F9C
MNKLQPSDPTSIGGYPLLGRLGAGGMGQVFLSRTASGRLLALKTIRDDLSSEPGFEERFAREIRSSDRVRSPWTVTVVDYSAPGQSPQWLATEYVPAPSLSDWVSAHGPLPASALLSLAAELAGAVQAVHQAGLAHRDIKPGNILLARDRPRLIDFGVARAADDSRHTRLGVSVGSPGYLAPDQATGGVAAEPADVFSLAAVLVYAATGQGPFSPRGQQIPAAALLYRVVHEEPDLDGVPAELVPLLAACLAKDPAARPTAARLAEWVAERGGRLGRWPEECPTGLVGQLTEAEHAAALTVVGLPAPAPGPGTVQATMVSEAALPVPAEPRSRQGRTAVVVGAVVAALAVAGAVVFTTVDGPWRSSGGDSAAAAGPSASGEALPPQSASPSEQPSGPAQEPQEPQESEGVVDPGAPLKVIEATFELVTGDSVETENRSLRMQVDGNLVIYDRTGKARWATKTSGEGNTARFQPDGNLVVYNGEGKPVWASRTNGNPGAVLVLQADGNMVVKAGDAKVWAAGSEG